MKTEGSTYFSFADHCRYYPICYGHISHTDALISNSFLSHLLSSYDWSFCFTDMRKIFPFELFHLGGDEVHPGW